ncbi:glycoside hydrolase family 9 protein [uncultured Pseudoteredinibacter sp.]|uniref:glycoside hydrolase family 9 protein n=1 Tax=uncultured Pseudoteredinibacter sp. TaxID=1641701 RepID=UPI0026314DC6|nr:glycoside hydrolase family 9 protein [uncultured Pseudoteredinibacter sp.]
MKKMLLGNYFRQSLLCSLCLILCACKTANQSSVNEQKIQIYANQVAYTSKSNKHILLSIDSSLEAKSYEVIHNDISVLKSKFLGPTKINEWVKDRLFYTMDLSSIEKQGEYRIIAMAQDGQEITSTETTIRIKDGIYFKEIMPAILHYFRENRHTDERDKNIPIYGSDRVVNVWGGWKDAGGDPGKYLSHLNYSNFLTPQQGAIVPWSLARSYQTLPELYRKHKIERELLEEVLWGADYLHRILDPKGYFYLTVFDQWGSNPQRFVSAYVGLEGKLTKDHQAAFREGAGIAIAALARAYTLSKTLGVELNVQGEFSADQYLNDAERAFAHLLLNNLKYCDNGKENIIDDYTALIAATELYRVTQKQQYFEHMQLRVDSINRRLSAEGWLISDNTDRPYYHAVEAGMPLIALSDYLSFAENPDRRTATLNTIKRQLNYQLQLNFEVNNPFNYPRQTYKSYSDIYGKGAYSKQQSGFFMPHKNETGYWWQGENARLASLATAALEAGRHTHTSESGKLKARLSSFAQHQLDWILGRNPYNICMLYGFGSTNPPYSPSGGDMVKGGISNGITGSSKLANGRGIGWAEGPEDNNWRWVEQWLQHSSWFVLAITAMEKSEADSQIQ